MIYQLTIYYGAMVNGIAIYSICSEFEDCKSFPPKINEDIFRGPIVKAIKEDGLNPADFELRYIKKEKYENRFEIEHEKTTITVVEAKYKES